MGKEWQSNKEAKKQPAMSPKEKKAAKREKKHAPAFAPSMPKWLIGLSGVARHYFEIVELIISWNIGMPDWV